MKRPSFQFYPGDWQHDINLRSCSLEARGLWIEMMAIFHQSDRYGRLPSFLLKQNSSKQPSKTEANTQANTQANVKQVLDPLLDTCLELASPLARLVGSDPESVGRALHELIESGVASTDEQGDIFSRRMIRDEEIRQVRANAGHFGGTQRALREREARSTAVLLKQNSSKQPSKTEANAQANIQQTPKQTSSTLSSKIQALHLQSSEKDKTEKEPPISPHGADAGTDAPQPPSGGHSALDVSKGENPDDQDVSGVLDQLFGADAAGSSEASESVGSAEPATPAAASGRPRAHLPSVTFRTWLERVYAAGEKAVPGDDPVFDYAEAAGIPEEFLKLQWHEFKSRYQTADKRYKDWREVFRKSVRGNWYRLWSLREGQEAMLTTAGVQADRVMRAGDSEEAA